MSLASLKRSRTSSIDKLVSAAAKLDESASTQKNGPDDRIWKPTVDKAGNGYAVIRFLPATEGEELPWVRYWDHGFKGDTTGLWYIEKSLTSIGQKDPLSEVNAKLWNSGVDADKDIARKQKRRLHYVSNIYVVSDSANPDNEGKVFLYQYGKKIFDKLMDAMQPQFEDEDPINPFDFWEGADFKLKIRNVEGYRNYDRSEFATPAPIADDETLEVVYKKLYPLNEFVDPANYKSYDELKARLDAVLGRSGSFTPQQQEDLSVTAESSPMKSVEPSESLSISDEDDDDTMSYFSKLASED
ncbi:hypothetical protein [uncultured Planktosalinus sp.]|uniref:hypothetical protein n=1 Tax=uncultured Planktosalinus sp. TaxID=1810935 RepID=UPI0030DCBC37